MIKCPNCGTLLSDDCFQCTKCYYIIDSKAHTAANLFDTETKNDEIKEVQASAINSDKKFNIFRRDKKKSSNKSGSTTGFFGSIGNAFGNLFDSIFDNSDGESEEIEDLDDPDFNDKEITELDCNVDDEK